MKHRFAGSTFAIVLNLAVAFTGPLLVVSDDVRIGQTGVAMIFVGLVGAIAHCAIRMMRR